MVGVIEVLGYVIFFLFFFSIITVFTNPLINIFDKSTPTKEDKYFFMFGISSIFLCIGFIVLESELAFRETKIEDSLVYLEKELNKENLDLRYIDINYKRSVSSTSQVATVYDLSVTSYDENNFEVIVTYKYNIKRWYNLFSKTEHQYKFKYQKKIPKVSQIITEKNRK